MADKVGDEFEGYITGVAAFGLFIELIEHFVEGLVHVSTMADDYYRFIDRAHILRGENTKKVYRLGDRVRVRSYAWTWRGGRSIWALSRSSRPCGRAESTARTRSQPGQAQARAASEQQRPGRRERAARRAEMTALARHRHGRPHRPRQVHARSRADRHRPGPPEGRTGARHHDRPRFRALRSGGRDVCLRGRAGPRAVRQEHARGRRRHRLHPARHRRRRVRQAADARALRYLPPAARPRRNHRADESGSGRCRHAGAGDARNARAGCRNVPRARADRSRVRNAGRRPAGAQGRADRARWIAAGLLGAAARCSGAAAHRPGLHDPGFRNGRDGNADDRNDPGGAGDGDSAGRPVRQGPRSAGSRAGRRRGRGRTARGGQSRRRGGVRPPPRRYPRRARKPRGLPAAGRRRGPARLCAAAQAGSEAPSASGHE